ncbi:cytochrome b5, partial [Eremomyces bilateralis CBS 781.70]
ILLLSSALSWFVTGDSVLWGWRPWWSRGDALGAWLNGPVILTDAELKQYDGSDPNTPIYVALNGTIYDVTGGRRIYGPGGSYNIFAGRDATRAFITGCFAEDLTPDTRGVEEMFMPIYPDEELSSDETSRQQDSASKASKTQVKLRRERDRRNANKQIRETIDHWAALFRGERGDKPYFEVGKVKREEGWLDALPKRALCESAKKSRPKVKDENSS